MKKLVFPITLFLVGVCFTTPVLAYWASIAYCRNTGISAQRWYGYSSSAVKESAIEDCKSYGGNNCISEMAFEDYCGSLARKRDDYSSKRRVGSKRRVRPTHHLSMTSS